MEQSDSNLIDVLIPLFFFAASVGVIILLIFRRIAEKKKETFEDRDN